MSARWTIERATGPARHLLERPWPPDGTRLISILRCTEPSLVLGSTQHHRSFDALPCSRHGIEVVRRSSGGGAVLLEPGRVAWVDVVLPADDPLAEHDVGRAFLWLGRAWAAALVALGFPNPAVHEGAPRRTSWSDAVCFAGVGTGEVTIGNRKVVGLSQRRTRQASRFQCAALLAWDPDLMAELLGLPDAALGDLASSAAGLDGVTVADVEDALVDAVLSGQAAEDPGGVVVRDALDDLPIYDAGDVQER